MLFAFAAPEAERRLFSPSEDFSARAYFSYEPHPGRSVGVNDKEINSSLEESDLA